jgi:hypothetical protein
MLPANRRRAPGAAGVSQPCGTYRVTGKSRSFSNAQRRFPIPLLRAVDLDPRRRRVSERSTPSPLLRAVDPDPRPRGVSASSTPVPDSPSPRRGSRPAPSRSFRTPNAGSRFPSPLPNRTRQALIPDSRSCPPFVTHIRSPMYHTRTVLSQLPETTYLPSGVTATLLT